MDIRRPAGHARSYARVDLGLLDDLRLRVEVGEQRRSRSSRCWEFTVTVIVSRSIRDAAPAAASRILLETWTTGTDQAAQRVSLTPGEALRLSRILVRAADDLTFVQRAA